MDPKKQKPNFTPNNDPMDEELQFKPNPKSKTQKTNKSNCLPEYPDMIAHFAFTLDDLKEKYIEIKFVTIESEQGTLTPKELSDLLSSRINVIVYENKLYRFVDQNDTELKYINFTNADGSTELVPTEVIVNKLTGEYILFDVKVSEEELRELEERIAAIEADYLTSEDKALLEEEIDASGHKITVTLVDRDLTVNLLDADDNIISSDNVELDEDDDKYIVSGVLQSGVITFTYNDGGTFDVDISDLITGLATETYVDNAVNQVSEALDAEVTRATDAEDSLSQRVSDIEEDYLTSEDKNDLEQEIQTVADDLQSEADEREAADATLQANINSEATARQAADTELQTNISNEASARQNADIDLSGRISALENEGFITQDINTSSIAVQYTKSTSKVSLVSTHEWHEYEGATEALLLSCAYGNGYYIAVGNNGVIVYSNDGQSWNLFGNMSNQPTIDKIVFGNGYFLAMSYTSRTIYKAYMPNGWTIQTTIADTINPTNLLYVNNHFILTGENGYIGFSQDGIKFKQLNTNISNIRINSVAYGNTVYLAVGDNGLLLYSKTGEVWNNITESQVDNYKNIIFYNGVFILNTNQSIRYSTDYYQFYDSIIPDLTTGGYNIQNMVAGESNFYVIATNNTNTLILNSANGQTFSTEYVANIAAYGITYGKENFITVGTGNKVYNLNLHINWTYNKPVVSNTEYLWARDVNNLNNGDTLYSQAYFMGYVDKDTDELVNYYTIPTTDDLLDGKQDDMVAIESSNINNLFN